VADSAFYTKKNLQSVGQHTFWITHVPSSIKEAKELLAYDCQFKPCTDERYSYFQHVNEYAGIWKRRSGSSTIPSPLLKRKRRNLKRDLTKNCVQQRHRSVKSVQWNRSASRMHTMLHKYV